jgi:hypothetical protein
LQKLQSRPQKQAIFRPIRPGTVFALIEAMQVARRIAVDGVIAVVCHPFMPYMLVLLGLLRRL